MSTYDAGPDTMPTSYDSNVAGSTGSKVDHDFLRSLKGILRIVEMIVSLIGFICAAVGKDKAKGAAGYCMFVTMFSFLVLTILFFLWLFRVLSNVGGKFPIKFVEFVMYVTWAGLYFIAGIVAAVNGGGNPAMGAAAFFTFAMLAICGVDAFFHHRYWFSSDEGPYICGKVVGGGGTGPPVTNPSSAPTDQRAPTY